MEKSLQSKRCITNETTMIFRFFVFEAKPVPTTLTEKMNPGIQAWSCAANSSD